jgi:hypothetical protein
VTLTPSPQILFLYPAHPLILFPGEFERVPSFCFPKGFEKVGTGRQAGDPVLDQFVFEIHSQARRWRIYGVSLVCTLSKVQSAFFINENSKEYPICFCFLTSNPILSVQFHYLYFLMKCLTGGAGRFIKHEATLTRVSPDIVNLLPGLVSAGITQHSPTMQIPRTALTELCFIGNIIPDPHEDLSVQLTERHSMTIPSQATALKCVCYASMDVLFSVLSIPHIIQVFSILILEKQVVFRSTNIHNLTLSLLCLRELVKPFRYRGTFLTVLPIDDKFLPILESPVPYACGILKTGKAVPIPSYVCIVDIDKDQVVDPDQSPVLAGGKEMIEKLTLLIEMNRADVIVPTRSKANANAYMEFLRAKRNPLSSSHSYYMYPRKYCFGQEIVDAIVLLFRDQFVLPMESLVRSCFITDKTDIDHPITVLNNEVFLESVEPDQREFYQQFMQTTMFQQFTELMTDEPSMSPLALSDASDMTPFDA